MAASEPAATDAAEPAAAAPAAGEAGAAPLSNRYSALCDAAALDAWHQTFTAFDRDGGGDVDQRELGLMFRQLGQSPSDEEVRKLVEEVDSDGSGTVDFEEFTLLMLRMTRAAECPEWVADLFDPDESWAAAAPSAVGLSDERFEAARTIQRRASCGRSAQLPRRGAATSATCHSRDRVLEPRVLLTIIGELLAY